MRKTILLAILLVGYLGFSQQEYSFGTQTTKKSKMVQQQNTEVEALVVKPANHPLLIAEKLQHENYITCYWKNRQQTSDSAD